MSRLLRYLYGVYLLLTLAACASATPEPAAPRLAAADRDGRAPELIMRMPELIAREDLFGNPERTRGRISPDGEYLSYLAPMDGVMNLFVAPLNQPDQARPVTATDRNLRLYFWTQLPHTLIYLQDHQGDENWQLYVVDVRDGKARNLTPVQGISARVENISPQRPQHILVGLNDRDPRWHDLYSIDLRSGERTLVQRNDGYESFVTDAQYRVVLALKPNADGSFDWQRPDTLGAFHPFLHVAMEDALNSYPVGVTHDGQILYALDSSGRDTAALYAIDLQTGTRRLLAEDPRADVNGLLSDPRSGRALAYSVNYLSTRWQALDESLQAVIDAMHKQVAGEIGIPAMTRDGRQWLIYADAPKQPLRYLVFDRQERQAQKLFDAMPALQDKPLATMHAQIIHARDGLPLVSYLTLPPGSDEKQPGQPAAPLPTVLLVHGGPWGRDDYGFNAEHQWLANRGYAVLSVNFRASSGFGKAFLNAGNGEWGAAMHNDLLDAVNWAVYQGIADEKRVAIMGGSYGGYAALSGLTFSPETFACAVDLFGPSNLQTMLENLPPYWQSYYEQFTQRVGDPRTEDGRDLLRERSPLNFAERIERPLLIGQGANDPRVKQRESDQIVDALKTRGIPVTYLLYPDEGHGFVRAENRLSFNATTEIFLSQYLGGRAESYGDDFHRSSTIVMHGGEYIGQLNEAVASARTLQQLDELPATAAGVKDRKQQPEYDPEQFRPLSFDELFREYEERYDFDGQYPPQSDAEQRDEKFEFRK